MAVIPTDAPVVATVTVRAAKKKPADGAKPEHDRRGHHRALRVFMWTLAPCVDSWTGLSLNRFLAILFAVASTHGIFWHDRPPTVTDLGFATLAGALAFGKDTWLAWVNRGGAQAT